SAGRAQVAPPLAPVSLVAVQPGGSRNSHPSALLARWAPPAVLVVEGETPSVIGVECSARVEVRLEDTCDGAGEAATHASALGCEGADRPYNPATRTAPPTTPMPRVTAKADSRSRRPPEGLEMAGHCDSSV